MFDFNCDIAQGYGAFNNEDEYKVAALASSINISAGFHAGDPVRIREALLFAEERNVAIGAHIGYPDMQGFGKRKMDLAPEELEAVVVYQIGAIINYAKTMGLEIEHVRPHGALKEEINSNLDSAVVVAKAIAKVSPWLNFIIQNPEFKDEVEKAGVKTALEVEFSETSSIRQIRELDYNPDTIHFRKLDDIKRAYDIIKPTPISYNRVQNQI